MATKVFDTPNYGEITLRNAMIGETDLYDIVEVRGEDIEDFDIEMYIPFDDMTDQEADELIIKYMP